MKVDDDSSFRYLYFSLKYIRLPLFTVISGWVYANKPLMPYQKLHFLKGKIRRLVIPMLVLSSLLFFFRWLIPGTNFKTQLSEYPSIFLYPYDVYWYLYSLFIIFLAISFLDGIKQFQNFKGWLATLLIALLLFYISADLMESIPNYFGFKGAIYLFPFFLLGIATFRFKDILFQFKALYLYLIVFAILITLQQLSWFGLYPMFSRFNMQAVAIGFSGVLLLLSIKVKSSFLIKIGGFAYGIFLFHLFFAAAFRIALTRAGIQNLLTVFVLTTIFSIGFSILIEKILRKSSTLQLIFLGLSSAKNKSETSGLLERNIKTEENTPMVV